MIKFLANARVIAGTIVSFVANRKLAMTKEISVEAFVLPTEGATSFLDVPKENVVEMRNRFSGSDVSFRAPSKKREMKIEFRLLHDIVAKALCSKAGSFDVVTSEKFDLMVAISTGLKISVLLEKLVKTDIEESVKLQPQKVLTNKSVQMYIKKNLDVKPTRETSNRPKKLRVVLRVDEQEMSIDGCLEGETFEIADWVEKDDGTEKEQSGYQHEKVTGTNEGAIVVRAAPEQSAQGFPDIQWICMELRVLRVLAGLPIVAPEASIAGDASSTDTLQIIMSPSAQPRIPALEFSTQAEQEKAAARKAAQPDEQPVPETDDQPHNNPGHSSSRTSSFHPSIHSGQSASMRFYIDSNPSSSANSTSSDSPSTHIEDLVINLQMVVYNESIEERIDFLDSENNEDSFHNGSQQVFVSSPPTTIHADSKLEAVEKAVVSLDSRMDSMDSTVQAID
ncbi:hypothetical protein F511_18765 [Dorcoceras hygrometricum]|uniref:Uncharacterized protein n=1 Tax=Dorcoceras hygrometricum TaxID=472368 RepID=A0A2Z7DGG4_9LAMI|nr:hypothetical protein F511_18765 [Dorcoceras hygrometricum]